MDHLTADAPEGIEELVLDPLRCAATMRVVAASRILRKLGTSNYPLVKALWRDSLFPGSGSERCVSLGFSDYRTI